MANDLTLFPRKDRHIVFHEKVFFTSTAWLERSRQNNDELTEGKVWGNDLPFRKETWEKHVDETGRRFSGWR